ncbi:adhesin [Escherichia coli]|nr:adhesin [Escherichia coli O88:H4]EGI9634746.1 adhesin [Escherichia coli]EHR7939453.1 adhesin [Escherichia coli]EHR9178807.1 adhesin [Escherichia coli]EJK7732465.1 adhesin [Escherichia coli]
MSGYYREVFVKDIRYVLSVAVCLYSSLATGGSAIYFSFKGSQTGETVHNTTSGQTITVPVALTSLGNTGTVAGVPECNGQYDINYYTVFYHRLGIPKKIQLGNQWVDVHVNAPGYVRDTDDYNYVYYYSNEENGGRGYGYAGKSCWNAGEVVDVTPFAPGIPPAVTLSVRIPPDLPDGLSVMWIPIKYGKNVNFLRGIWDWNNHRKDLMSAGTTIAAKQTETSFLLYRRDIINKARCSFDQPSYEIDHKNVSINDALANTAMAETNVKLTCTAPTDVKIKLSTPKTPNYNNSHFSVNLGNGWDSVISLDGYPYDEANLQNKYVTQSGRTIKIGSKLYGEVSKVKPGGINGSLVMTFDFQ